MKGQEIDAIIQNEIQSHHPVKGVDEILQILVQAEQGYLVRQAELFDDMEERDTHIGAEMAKRKMQVSQLDWSLVPASSAGAKEKKDVEKLQSLIIDNVDVESLVLAMSDGIGKGFSCIQIEWARDQLTGLWVPGALRPRPARWFTVDRATRQNIRIRTGANSIDGAELLKDQWICHHHFTRSATGPATSGLFRQIALPYVFKNFAIKNWLRFCQSYGIPLRVLFHNEKDEAKKRALRAALYSLGSSGVALIEGGTTDDLKTVDLTSGEGQGFQALVDWSESSVSKAILGGTLTSDSGKNGNYATANIHDSARIQIRNHDSKQIAETLTRQFVGAMARVNGLSIRARWVFDTQDPEDLALYADALPKLAARKVRIPLKYVHDKLKIPQAVDGEEIMDIGESKPEITPKQPQQGSGLAYLSGSIAKSRFTKEQQAVEDLADELLKRLSSPVDPEAIAAAIRGAKDPQDLDNRLAVALGGADFEGFADILERALFAADVMGYAHG